MANLWPSSGSYQTASDASYPDFIALTGQDNSPPGGQATYDYWLRQVALDESSLCLDMACSTGLSARTITQRSGCRAFGVDVSYPAIAVARDKALQAGLANRLSFIAGDATRLPFRSSAFDAVVVGSSLGFIAAREVALSEAARVLKPEGALLVACRHYIDAPPSDLLDDVENAIGYRPDPSRDYDWWQTFFRRQFMRSEEMHLLIPPTDPERAAANLAKEAEEPHHPMSRLSVEDRSACLDRLRHVRSVLCAHHLYQGLSLMVWWR